jgi:FMN phosphatase YigB (HAD superfamily)
MAFVQDYYVFFDVDDTLIEWKQDWQAAFMETARGAGVEVSAAQVTEALNAVFHSDYEDCLRRHAASGDLTAFWIDYDGRILAHLGVTDDLPRRAAHVVGMFQRPGAVELYPEVREVLQELVGAGALLGIVTERPLAGPDLTRLGVAQHFSPVIDAFGTESTKRHPLMFDLAAEAAARAGRVAWHVGDSYRADVLGARRAGIRPILLDRHARHPEPDCACIDDLRQLADVLRDGANGGAR